MLITPKITGTILKIFSTNNVLNALLQYPLHRIKTRCPAFMFAISRTDRVKGRTIILTSSTILKKGFSSKGAPPGKNLAINILRFVLILDKIRNVHKGNAKVNTKNPCLLYLI